MQTHSNVALTKLLVCEAMEKKVNSRITIIFSDEAAEWLNAQALRRSLTISELLRRMVDEVRGSYIIPRQPPQK